jgi:UDP-N-acetylmuramoyl-L-alanyl-D-glutamate--2,6-diaminopimelate ligase
MELRTACFSNTSYPGDDPLAARIMTPQAVVHVMKHIEKSRSAEKVDASAGTQKTHLDARAKFHQYPAALTARRVPHRPARRSTFSYTTASTPQARRPRVTQWSTTSAGVSLRALLAQERDARTPNLRVTSCTNDWRQLRPGDVFVAIAGAEEDGHVHAAEASRRGAAAVICERPLPVFGVPQIVVRDSRVVYGRLCQELVGNPADQLKVIGVTGTHGKTTVARLLSSVFRSAGASAGSLDSFGSSDADDPSPSDSGGLSPPKLATWLAQTNATGASHAVVEISSRELSQQVLAGVSLDAVCMTHVGRRHLGWYGSVENYRRAKRRIFDYMHPDAVAILNADDPTSVAMLSELNQPALTYGMRLPAEITAEIIEQHINEQVFVLSAGGDSVGVRTPLIGDHHVYNCLAATTTALAYGLELPDIARGLEAVDYLPGRMERVACGQEFATVVDAADSPEALRVCLRAIRQATRRRVICVFGAHDECDLELQATGRVMGAMSDIAVVTHGYPSDGSHRSCMEIRAGFAAARKPQVILDRVEAIAWALHEAQCGDAVVIAGMGQRCHTLSANDGALINDCEIVRKILRGRLTATPQARLAA